MTDPERLEEQEKTTLVAYVKYGLTFSQYIKENDPVLWKRATEYAKDCTESNVVSFDPKEEPNEESNDEA